MNQNKQSSTSEDNLTRFADALGKAAMSLSLLTWHGHKRFLNIFVRSTFTTCASLIVGFLFVKFFIENAFHIKFLAWIWPALFSGAFLRRLYENPEEFHYGLYYAFTVWLVILTLGSRAMREQKKLKEVFESIGLANALGVTPKLISKTQLDEFRDKYVFKGNGVPMSRFELKRPELEANFHKIVESIETGSDPSIVKVTLTTKILPEFVKFESLDNQESLTHESFFVGESMSGLVTAKLSDLPHLLIAGATGGGKSIFFKQVLTGLLKSSPHLQVYFIDLKKGLEAADFKKFQNVSVAKDIHEAVIALEAVNTEMNHRFKYLEAKGFKSIEPKRDKMDRILIAVDEASELYAEKNKFDDDYELSYQAQKITNSIARLGRAAGIHLILATQKVQKESINTIIQENVSARMCFKMNTLQGSLQVLGSKDALDLPMTKGRGIWQHGTQQVVVQVPFINEAEIEKAFAQVGLNKVFGGEELFQEMLVGSKPNTIQVKPSDAQKSLVDIDV